MTSATNNKTGGRNEVKRASCLATEKVIKHEPVGEDNNACAREKRVRKVNASPLRGIIRESYAVSCKVYFLKIRIPFRERRLFREYMPRVTRKFAIAKRNNSQASRSSARKEKNMLRIKIRVD